MEILAQPGHNSRTARSTSGGPSTTSSGQPRRCVPTANGRNRSCIGSCMDPMSVEDESRFYAGSASQMKECSDGCSRARSMSTEFILDTPTVRAFVTDVQESIARTASPPEACEAIRPRFARLLTDPDWLPSRYQADAPESGMGGGIGQW